jgi:hypothetical protein
MISAIWLGRGLIRPGDSSATISVASVGIEVPVHVSYSAPRYTFRRQGAMVVDALTPDTRVADGTLLANNKPSRTLYDH